MPTPYRLSRKLTPDFERLRRVLTRQGRPDRVPFIEFYPEQAALAALLGEEPIFESETDRAQTEASWRQRIRFYQAFGYDYVGINAGDAVWARLKRAEMVNTEPGQAARAWVAESAGVIMSMEDVERYQWPKVSDVDFYPFEFVARELPEGMKIIASADGFFELTREMMGFESFAIALMEQPELVRALLDRIGPLVLSVFEQLVTLPGVGAIHQGDDMCYKTGPMIAPELLREFFFPWHRKVARLAHQQGFTYSLHCDGDNTLIMEDLLTFVGIDGKHAFEDAARPVESYKRQYGTRLALLGGVDMNLLCRATPEELRPRVREIVEVCAVNGGFAIGTGNSLATYIPPANFVTMLEAALDVGA